MGASFIFTIGNRYAKQSCDTKNSVKSIPYFHYDNFDDFYKHLPKGARKVGLEITQESKALEDFCHPKRCLYLLGVEDHGLSKKAIEKSHFFVKFSSIESLNVALAGSIVQYDRSRTKPRV